MVLTLFLLCIFVFVAVHISRLANMLQTERKIIVLHDIFTSCNQFVAHSLMQRSAKKFVLFVHCIFLELYCTYKEISENAYFVVAVT